MLLGRCRDTLRSDPWRRGGAAADVAGVLLLVQVIEAALAEAGEGGEQEGTLLVVMGDHGQTPSGDHGGGTPEARRLLDGGVQGAETGGGGVTGDGRQSRWEEGGDGGGLRECRRGRGEKGGSGVGKVGRGRGRIVGRGDGFTKGDGGATEDKEGRKGVGGTGSGGRGQLGGWRGASTVRGGGVTVPAFPRRRRPC